MIRKYLVIANRISLASTQRDSIKTTGPLIELLMPVDIYWEIEEHLKQYDLQASSGDDSTVLDDLNKKILRFLIPYAVSEKDRSWLSSNAGSSE